MGKFVIYEMVQPVCLIDYRDNNEYTNLIFREALEKLNVVGVDAEHPTFKDAATEIDNKKELLANLKLTIIPIYSISWDGKIL